MTEPSPLLVVIDMQRVYADPGNPWFVPTYEAVAEHVERLLPAFGGRVLFTRFLAPSDPQGSWKTYYRTFDFILQPEAGDLLRLDPRWEDKVTPVRSGAIHRAPSPTSTATISSQPYPLLDTTTFSKYGPVLESLAGQGGTLVLCGVTAECCVLSTALQAVDAGMYVRYVADATNTVDEVTYESALQVARGYAPQLELTTTEEEVARRAAAAPLRQ